MAAQLLNLREYQRETIDAVNAAWADGMQRPAVVMATGLGKTVIFSHLISEFIARTGQRAVVLVHRDELADQALNKLRDVAPHLSLGKVKAQSNEIGAQVMVCSVQTLARGTRVDQLGKVGLVIADEVHHYASKTYKAVLEKLGVFTEGGPKMVGFTATLARGDKAGLGDVIEDLALPAKGVMFGISKGFLVKPEGRLVVTEGLNLGAVKKTSGDYQAGDLGRAMEDSGLAKALPGIYREHASSLQGVVFTPTVATAQAVADEFCDAGIPAEMVCGETPRDERLKIFDAYRKGKLQALVNPMVLTEGWDMPQASVAVIARPTQSKTLYQQMVGRVLRPFPGKTSALILDVVGASVDNKLCTLIDLEPGLFKDPKPCENCECIPCKCLCGECGNPKYRCECEKETREFKGLDSGKSGSIDLFTGSSQSWLSTKRGVMFIPAGGGEVFLWESWKTPGTWCVGYLPKNGRADWMHMDLSMGTAMAWAETEADDRSDFNVRRTASWRRTKASDAQKGLAQNLKIQFQDDVKKGDLGNMISIELASRRLDPKLRK